jgi:hypothetical protein
VTMEDVLVPARNQRDLARRIPGVAVDELPIDHDGVFSHPAVFVPALTWAIEDVLARSKEAA